MDVNNQKISKLESTKISCSNDLFMVSERISDRIFLSRKHEYESLSSYIIDSVEQISTFNPSGTWIFTEGVGIPTRKTTTSGLSSCVVTCEQLSVAFMNLFNKLSVEIYSKTHIPSCVGEIIYTTKLKTEAMVKKYYGDYTSWIQLPGRIILASGSQNLTVSGIKGGEDRHVLSLSEIPAHQHKFIAENNTKTLTASLTLEAEEGKEILKENTYPAHLAGHKWHEDAFGVTTEKHHPDSKVEKEGTIYGNNGAEVIIAPDSTKIKSHNNMPPFYSVYVWRRTK